MLDTAVYDGLKEKVGARKIGKYLSELARPLVVKSTLADGYKALSLDTKQESDAREWIEGGLEDFGKKEVWRL